MSALQQPAPCPICRGSARRLGVLPARHPLHACASCGHRFALATQAQLENFYGGSYEGFREDAVFPTAAKELFEREILPRVGKVNMLDVGCGNGAVLRIAKRLGIEALGIDISSAAVAACVGAGLDARVADFTSGEFDGRGFGLVSFWDVLEHLREPSAFIRSAARALRPEGWLLIKVPHHRALSLYVSAAVPRLSGPVLAPPSHLQYFERSSLKRVLGAEFDRIEWIEVGALRESITRTVRGASFKKRVARRIVGGIRAASGDGTLLVMARRAA